MSGSYIQPAQLNLDANNKQSTTVRIVCQQGTGTPVSNLQVQILVAPSVTVAQSPSYATTDANGVAAITLTPSAAGPYSLQLQVQKGDFTSTVPTANSGLVAFPPGLQQGVPSGTKLDTQVTIVNTAGVLQTGYRGTVHFTSTDPLASLPADATFSASDGGNKLFAEQVRLYTYGSQTVTVMDTQTRTSLSTQTYVVVPSAANPGWTTQLTVTPSTGLTADGRDAATVAVAVSDGSGSPISGATVDLQVSGTGNAYSSTLVTDANGMASTFLTSTVAETKTFTCAAHTPDGVTPVSQTASVTFVAGPAALATSTLTANPNSVVADGQTMAILLTQVRDAQGNPISGLPVSLSSEAAMLYTPQSGATDATGSFAARVASVVAGDRLVTAAVGDLNLTVDVAFVAGPPSASTSSLTPTPTTLVAADGTSFVTLHVLMRDAQGNPVAGEAIVFSATGASNIFTPAGAYTDTSGMASTRLTSTVPQTKQVAASTPYVHLQAWVGFAPAVCEQTMLLPTAPVIKIGNGPGSIAYGDFNRDGKVDLATANSDNVSVALGRGDGSFAKPVAFAAGSSPEGLVAADLNHDGKLDLVTANSSANISILLGHGDGTFATVTNYATGASPCAPAVGDLNNDGKLDIVVSSTSANTVNVLLGRGDGTFSAAVSYATDSDPIAVAIADVDGQGGLDVVTANSSAGTASVLLGNGDGTLGAAANFALGSSPGAAMAVVDVSGDGNVDIVSASSGSLDVLLGGGDGTFGPVTAFAADTGEALAVADINADGILDVVMATIYGPTEILFGTGGGAFAAPVRYTVGYDPDAVAAVDINADGKLDLIVSNGLSNSLTLLIGLGDGTFAQATTVIAGSNIAGLAAADFNGDGDLDLAAADDWGTSLLISWGRGNLTFNAATAYAAGSGLEDVATGDLNGDGKIDVVAASDSNNAITWLGNGDGTLAAPRMYPVGALPLWVGVADLNGDGDMDVVTVNYTGNSNNSASVLLGGGDGSLAAAVHYVAGANPHSASLTDLNGDHKVDLAVADEGSESVILLLGRGDGTFSPATSIVVGGIPTGIAAADFNRDGKPDLGVVDDEDNTAIILVGHGDGTFAAPVSYVVGLNPLAISTGDIDGDGNLDVITANYFEFTASLLLGLGDGTFATAVEYGVGDSPQCALVADFNNDNSPDIAVGGRSEILVLSRTACVP